MKSTRRTDRAARALFRASLVGGVLDAGRVHDVTRLLAKSRHHDAVVILSAFGRLVRIETARRSAVVESATPLPSRTRSDIQTQITRMHGRLSLVTFTQNPALIGGVRVRVGSRVYDGSVRARLSALEAAFVSPRPR